jgi:hypothetical protein
MGNPDSNLFALNRAAEYSKATWEFNYYISSQKLPRIMKWGSKWVNFCWNTWKLLRHRPIRGGETRNGARKGSVVADKTDLLCSCTVQERMDLLENANSDSRGGMFLAVSSVYACWIGPERETGHQIWRKGSVVAVHEKDRTAIPEAASMLLVTSNFLAILIISAKVNPFWVPFHDSGPIQHQ